MEKLLTEVCKIQYGFPFDSSRFNKVVGMPLIRIRDINLGKTETFTTENFKDEFVVKKGDILVGMDGEFNVAKWSGVDALLNQRVCRLIPFDINADYLYYHMPKVLKEIEEKTPFVTVKHLSAKQLNSIQLQVPASEKQQFVADVLNKINNLIGKRKQQLQKLDGLVKSRFVEMFGDPIKNDFGWETSLLRVVTTKIGSGATPKGGKESYIKAGISLIRSMNVHDAYFEYKDLAHLTDEQANQLKNVEVFEQDVLINITGASVARSCVVPNRVLPARVNQHVAIIRCKKNFLNPIYLNNMLLQASVKKMLLELGEAGGATRQAITKTQLEEICLVIPPIQLQNQFADFVQQIDKSKLEVQKSLEKLETLKKALMQKYFG